MKKGNHRRFYFRMGVLAIALLALAGCGVKAPPVPPGSQKPADVENLSLDRDGNRIVLTWRLAKAGGDIVMPESFIVYRSTTSLSVEPCGPCPEVFEPIASVDMPSPGEGKGLFTYSETPKPGNRYIYEVAAYSSSAGVGFRSNPVLVKVEEDGKMKR